MANETHIEILKKGAADWNKWREQNPEVIPDFSWANIPSLNLSGYNFESANMKLAFCKGCDFTKAIFKNANLYGANLEDTICKSCDFSGADLEGALIKDANLKGSNLSECNFRLCNIEGSCLEGTDLSGSKKLKADQLSKTSTLYNAKISERLLDKLQNTNPDLLAKTAD